MEDLNKPSAKNKKYISPQNQNEPIEVISYDILKNDLIKEIKDAMFYATNRWSEEIVMKLWEFKKKCNLDIEECWGQGYDETTNMPSEVVGVHGQIKEMY